MGKLVFHISMSLDGFVAGPNDEVDQLFKWYFSGDTDFSFPGAGYQFKISRASAEYLKKSEGMAGSIITGRRNFDLAGAWGGQPPLGVPHVVMTHRAPQEWVKEGSPYTFVSDGIESAIETARQLAGGKDVVISSPNVMRQALKAGLLDEINIDLVHLLLGQGVRLFEQLGLEPIDLECLETVAGGGVTHYRFRVVR